MGTYINRPDVALTTVGDLLLDSSFSGLTFPPCVAQSRTASNVATAHPLCRCSAHTSFELICAQLGSDA